MYGYPGLEHAGERRVYWMSDGGTGVIRIKNIAPVTFSPSRLHQAELRESSGRRFGCEVNTVWLARGPAVLEDELDAVRAGSNLIVEVESAEGEGYDAITIDCFLDPCLEAAASATGLPVVGMGRAALSVAMSIGGRIGIVTVLDKTRRNIERNVAKYGLADFVTCCETIDISCSDLSKDPVITSAALGQCLNTMSRLRECDVIILGCTSLEEYLDDEAKGNRSILKPSYCAFGLASMRCLGSRCEPVEQARLEPRSSI